MITSVRLVNFKNFADATLKVGPFTVIVGANASGKSNIRDAFRFLHGIGRGYYLPENLGGQYGPGGQLEWAGIRGAMNEIIRLGQQALAFEVEAKLEDTHFYYSLEVDYGYPEDSAFLVKSEELKIDERLLFTCYREGQSFFVDIGDPENPKYLRRPIAPFLSDAIRTYRPPDEKTLIEDPAVDLKDVFANMRFLDLIPELMREPAFPGSKLGDSGQNLATALETICADSQSGRNLMSWLQELTPMDVKDFDFPRDPSGRIHLHIVERNGRKVSAYSASDGTLRFLGILAALLGPNEGGLYFFEEIDNGIHPNRLWLLLDLIEHQTAEGGIQVITTTHSPALLAWMNDTTFEHTSVVYRDEYWADSVIRPIAGLYNLRELRKSQGLERLLTNGWFETATKASEGDADSDHSEDDDEDDWEQGVLE